MPLNVSKAITRLQAARQRIDGLNYLLCHALKKDAGVPPNMVRTGDETIDALLDYIEHELCKTYSVCLDTHVCELMRLAGEPVGSPLRQRVFDDYIDDLPNPWQAMMRHAWIDRMIHELETEGKLP